MWYFCYSLCFLLLLISCGNKAKSTDNITNTTVSVPKDEMKYVRSVSFTSPEKNKLYSYNDELNIAFESKDRFPVDSAQIFINGQKIAVTGKNEKKYIYRIPERKTGNTTIKVIAYHPENKQGVATITIKIKPDKAPQKYGYEIVRILSHDPKSYTQGLVYKDGFMYEGSGQYGESAIRKIDMTTGKILSMLNIDNQYFGEGIAIFKDKIYQITWKSQKGFVYDLNTFTLESTFHYNSQGWGITTAGEQLIMSDGTNRLYYVAPSSFNIVKEIEVYDNQGEIVNLNELEYVNGMIWANIWLSDRIVAIDPETGAVKGELDMTNLLPEADKKKIDNQDDVLNGIAYNPKTDTFYLTGKRWPKLFEIKIKKQ